MTPIPARAPAPRPRHTSARARGGDSFQGRAAIGAARAPPAKSAGSAHARAVRELQLRLSEQSSRSRSAPVPRCSHHKQQIRRDSARTLHAPVDRAGHSACELNREREGGWRRVDSDCTRAVRPLRSSRRLGASDPGADRITRVAPVLGTAPPRQRPQTSRPREVKNTPPPPAAEAAAPPKSRQMTDSRCGKALRG